MIAPSLSLNTDCLRHFDYPIFADNIYSGKVRDSVQLNDSERLIVVSDRISAFNIKIKTPIPHKGAVLNGLANFWLEKTRHILPNHLLRPIDANATLVRNAEPIRVEMVVRAYVAGTMWKAYQQGQRLFGSTTLPEGLQLHSPLPTPIITPTTKDADDTPISPADIVATGLASADLYAQMEKAALQLFSFGSEYLRQRGIILVDTKYEFGILPQTGELILIDELHTPDSSRFWWADDYAKNPQAAEQIDKEFLRRWLSNNRDENGTIRTSLPDYIVEETARRYLQIYEIITGAPLRVAGTSDIRTRLLANLRKAALIPAVRAAVLTGFGINCEEETAAALRLAGAEADILHLNEIFIEGKSIAQYDIIAFAGGFSFGDDIASGRVLANKIRFRRLPNGRTLLDELKDFIAAGKYVIGICNGFQMLTRLGLLPNIGGNFEQEASLIHNDSAQFEDRWVCCVGTGTSRTPFAKGISRVDLPIRHGEGKLLFKDKATRQAVENMGLCVLQYADPATGKPTAQYPANPNGAELHCAALCDTTGQVFALMPHPEAFLSKYNHPDFAHLPTQDDDYGSGLQFFENIVLHTLRKKA